MTSTRPGGRRAASSVERGRRRSWVTWRWGSAAYRNQVRHDKDFGALEEIRSLLESLGLPIDQISNLLSRLRLLNELDLLSGPPKALAENDALKQALSVAGTALNTANLVVDFLPTVAVTQISQSTRPLLLRAQPWLSGLRPVQVSRLQPRPSGAWPLLRFTGGVATVVGVVVGEAAGTVMHKMFAAADEQFDITENVAEAVLDSYRFMKERDFDPGRIAVDGVVNLVEGTIDGAQNLVEGMIDGGKNLVEGVGGFLNPFD